MKIEDYLFPNIKKLCVPYYAQERKTTCGPASLRMVLGYYGFFIPEKEIRGFVSHYSHGTSREEMVELVRVYNFIPRARCHGKIDDLVTAIDNEDPAIVDWNIGKEKINGHFSVIYGYGENMLYIHDPFVKQRHTISPKGFLALWGYNYHTKEDPKWFLICHPKHP